MRKREREGGKRKSKREKKEEREKIFKLAEFNNDIKSFLFLLFTYINARLEIFHLPHNIQFVPFFTVLSALRGLSVQNYIINGFP